MWPILLIIIACPFSSWSSLALRAKYPQGLLTKDYGILTEKDLLFDVEKWGEYPQYDVTKSQPGQVRWQCFRAREADYSYSTWRDTEGPNNSMITLCDFRIWIKSTEPAHHYYGRRAWPVENCRDFHQVWKRLTGGEDYLCLSGHPDSLGKANKNEKYKNVKGWTWSKIKTKKGCHSYFDGDCDLKTVPE